MDRFKHSVSATDIGTSGSSYAALQLCRFIGNDIAIQIRQDEYVEIAVDLIVNQVGCHDIYIPVVGLDLRVILGNIVAEAEEFTVSFLHDIRLGHDGNILVSVVFRIFKSGFRQSGRSDRRRHLEVDGDIVIDLYAAASQCILAFCIFSVKDPVDIFFRDHNRPYIGEEIQFSPESYIGALDVR